MKIKKVKPITAETTGLNQYDKQRVEHFVASINRILPDLNQAIDTYNQTTDPTEKLNQLSMLHQRMSQVDAAFSDEVVSKSFDYVFSVHDQLFTEIQQAFNDLNHSSSEVSSPDEVIRNMSHQKASQLAEILEAGGCFDEYKLKNLYQTGEAGKAAWDAFMATHLIGFLGGVNSKNFFIKNRETREICVVVFQNRMSIPRQVEMNLRGHGVFDKNGGEVLTPLFADRQVSYLSGNGGEMVTRRLMVTSYCQGSNVLAHAKKYPDDAERLDAAFDVYGQMASILEQMTAAGCAFPDMKNTNWLIDSSGGLRIADTKSFKAVLANGCVNSAGGFVLSLHLEPPEFGKQDCSADKMHVYMMAIDMYQYTTQCTDLDFRVDPNNPNSPLKKIKDLNFDLPVFKRTEKGRKMAAQIKSMLQSSADARPSLRDVNAMFNSAKPAVDLSGAVKTCMRALDKIKALGLGQHDAQMHVFIELMEGRLSVASTESEIQMIKQDMEGAYNDLEANKALIEKVLKVLQKLSGPDAHERQVAVLNAIGSVPFEERKMISQKQPQSELVQQARSLIQAAHKTPNTATAANIEAFQDFKEKAQRRPDKAADNQGKDVPSQ